MGRSEHSSTAGILLPVFISTLSNGLAFTSVPTFIAQKLCSPSGQPDINSFICRDKELVAESASITVAKGTIRSLLGAVSSPIIGRWRDRTGRNKRLLYIGEAAETLTILFYFLAAWNWSGSPWIPAVMEAIVGGLFGGEIFRLGSDCIVIEGSKPEERTMRLQLFSTSAFVSILLAMLFRGFMLSALGYQNYFLLVICFHLVAITLVRFSVEDVKKQPTDSKKEETFSLKTVFKPRPNSSVIWLMLLSKAVFMAFFQAENIIGTYVLQQAFHFTVKEEAFFGSFCLLINLIGSFTMPMLLIKILKWSDFKIGMVSSFLAIVSAISMGFARSRTTLFMIPLLDLLKYNMFSLPQAILSKCISNDELGLFNGLSSILGIFLPFGINYLYKATFSATSQTSPGAIYFLSASGNTIIFILYCISAYMYCHMEQKKEKSEDDENGDKKTN